MKIRGDLALVLAFATVVVVGCSGSDDDDDMGGGATDGSTTGAETTGGDTSDGGDTAGDGTTGGGTTGGGSTDGGTTDGGLGGSVSSWGMIEVQQDSSSTGDTVELNAFFATLSGAELPPASLLQEAVVPPEDSCTVSQDEVPDFEIPDLDTIDVNFDTVSAGDVITFTSPAGTYAQLNVTSQLGFTFYEDPVEDRSGPLPADLVVDIPGDEFPAFANVEVPNVEPLVVTSPVADNEFLPVTITPDTTFTWEAGSNPDARILINAFSIDFTSGDSISLDCTVLDDGNFEFPASIKSELGSDFSATGEIERSAFNFLQQGNAVLIVSNQF